MELTFNCKNFFLSSSKNNLFIFYTNALYIRLFYSTFAYSLHFPYPTAILPDTNLWINYNNFQSLHVILLNSFNLISILVKEIMILFSFFSVKAYLTVLVVKLLNRSFTLRVGLEDMII